MKYDFVLIFNLPTIEDDPFKYMDRLFEEGCDDATVSCSGTGMIALDFTRESETFIKAMLSAHDAVLRAIPGAEFISMTRVI